MFDVLLAGCSWGQRADRLCELQLKEEHVIYHSLLIFVWTDGVCELIFFLVSCVTCMPFMYELKSYVNWCVMRVNCWPFISCELFEWTACMYSFSVNWCLWTEGLPVNRWLSTCINSTLVLFVLTYAPSFFTRCRLMRILLSLMVVLYLTVKRVILLYLIMFILSLMMIPHRYGLALRDCVIHACVYMYK